MVMLARIVRIAAAVVCGIIALAILFVLLDANAGNSIVSTVLDWGKTLAGPFDGRPARVADVHAEQLGRVHLEGFLVRLHIAERAALQHRRELGGL